MSLGPIDITVCVKSEEVTLKERFLSYDPIMIDENDPIMKSMVEDTLSKYKGKLVDPDITITLKLSW